MLKRKIFIYVALLAIIIGGAPYFTGYLAETKFKDVLQVFSENSQSVSITVVKYERGWRQSHAQTKMTISGPYSEQLMARLEGLDQGQRQALQDEGFSVLLNHDIRHGPFVQVKDGDWKDWRFALAMIHSEILLTDKSKETLEKVLGKAKLLDINTEMSIEGAVKSKFEGASFNVGEGSNSLVWKGLHGIWQLNRDMKRIQSEVIFPGVSYQQPQKGFTISDLVMRNDVHKSTEGLWLGKGTINIQNVMVTDSQNADSNINLTSIVIGATTKEASDATLLDASGTITVESVKVGKDNYGPFNYLGSVSNINAKFVKIFIDYSRNHESINQATLVQELMPLFLKPRPVLNIENVSLKTTDGDLKGNLMVAMGGPEASDINNIAALIQSVDAKAMLNIPKTMMRSLLAKQYTSMLEKMNAIAKPDQKALTPDEMKQQAEQKVQEQIDSQLKAGYLVEKDNYYASEIEFSKGQLKVNGKVMAFPPQPAMSAMPTPPAQPTAPPVN